MRRRLLGPVILVTLLLGLFVAAFRVQNVKAGETIHIRANGSIEPSTANITSSDNVTYYFTDNNYDSIVVERDNIVLDGKNYTLLGRGGGDGIDLRHRSNVTINNVRIENFTSGIFFWYSSYNKIIGNNITDVSYGIDISFSSNNTIYGNNIKDNSGLGILVAFSSNTSIHRNNIENNNLYGIFLGQSSNNTIYENSIGRHSYGIWLYESHSNTIHRNSMRYNWHCICVEGSSNNIIIGNDIRHSFHLPSFEDSSNNLIYHNNFRNYKSQADIKNSVNAWDSGYPSGGNYWSEYACNDTHSGPYQNETGSDGIGDTPYIMNADNADHYPLIYPWSSLPVHNINTGLRYQTIQEAINANETLDGHTIFVGSGTYSENVVVDKSVTLIGENKDTTIIDGKGSGSVITIVTGNVTITGFRIQNCSFAGIEFEWAGDLWAGGNNNISNNVITGTGMGIWVSFGSSNNIISGNTIVGGGISLGDFSDFNTIVGNNITGDGIGLWRAMGNTISGNNIEGKSGWCGGITLSYYSEYNRVFDNNIKDARAWGFWLSDLSVSNRIFRNNVVNCDGGIWISCSDNTFYHNNFVNSSRVDIIRSVSNVWDNGVEGNYWSNYTGVDSDHDGIGDTPHIFDGSNQDNYPLMGMFNSFNTSVGKHVNVISSSTIENFRYFESNNTIRFYVSNMTNDQIFGFCRVCIHRALMSGTYSVTINGADPIFWNYTLYEDKTHRWIYFEFEHSKQEVVIVPELPSLIILPLFMIATLVIAMMFRKHRLRC